MSNQVFDFCATSRVIQELPPDEIEIKSMNGWPFTPKPKLPFQREFKVRLNGIRWYLNSNGNALDITTDPTHNAGRLLSFYRDHRLWDSFLINHEYLGQLRVRFKTPVIVPEGDEDSGGKVPRFEVRLIHHDPGY